MKGTFYKVVAFMDLIKYQQMLEASKRKTGDGNPLKFFITGYLRLTNLFFFVCLFQIKVLI